MIRSIFFLAIAASFVAVPVPVGMAQSVELKPIDRIDASDLPYSRSPYYGPSPEQVKDFAALREEYRKSQWADEAGRIARYGQSQNVIRDDDYLYINDASGGRAFAFRNIWGVDPAALYAYLAYDDLAHSISLGRADMTCLDCCSSPPEPAWSIRALAQASRSTLLIEGAS